MYRERILLMDLETKRMCGLNHCQASAVGPNHKSAAVYFSDVCIGKQGKTWRIPSCQSINNEDNLFFIWGWGIKSNLLELWGKSVY